MMKMAVRLNSLIGSEAKTTRDTSSLERISMQALKITALTMNMDQHME